MRETLAATGSAELPYWAAFFRMEDERRIEELKFAAAGAVV